jgi:hypothetical protein
MWLEKEANMYLIQAASKIRQKPIYYTLDLSGGSKNLISYYADSQSQSFSYILLLIMSLLAGVGVSLGYLNLHAIIFR